MENAKRMEILSLIERDARLKPEQIATMIGETPEAVAAVIHELEAAHAILQYTAVVDWDRAGGTQVTALIEVKIAPQRDTGFDRLAERIARFPEVRSCYLMSGAYDLTVEVQAANLREVARFVSERLSTIEGVSAAATHFVMKRYKHDGILYESGDGDERLAVTP
ncbi:MAG: Lrp/AsnC family transcriptional regulator [Mycobacterium leprae]